MNYDTAKRLGDITASVIALPFALCITYAAALAIVLIDHQSPLFMQKRGLNSDNIFTIYKLRTMKDHKATSLGSFLRKYGIDEIPQLRNVLKGDMSIVGPRPIPESNIPSKEGRVGNAKAGITGLFQTQKNHKEMTDSRREACERLYNIRKSLLLDLLILLKTIPYILSGKNKDHKN